MGENPSISTILQNSLLVQQQLQQHILSLGGQPSVQRQLQQTSSAPLAAASAVNSVATIPLQAAATPGNSRSSPITPVGNRSSVSDAVVGQYQRLFNRRPSVNYSSSAPAAKRKKARSFQTREFCLLSRVNTRRNDAEDHIRLLRAGLGRKDIALFSDATAEEVETALFEAFPKLNQAGGYEIMKVKDHKVHDLVHLCAGPINYAALKSYSKRGVFYVVPLQQDLSTAEDPLLMRHQRFETCLVCNNLVALDELKEHRAGHNHEFVQSLPDLSESDEETDRPLASGVRSSAGNLPSALNVVAASDPLLGLDSPAIAIAENSPALHTEQLVADQASPPFTSTAGATAATRQAVISINSSAADQNAVFARLLTGIPISGNRRLVLARSSVGQSHNLAAIGTENIVPVAAAVTAPAEELFLNLCQLPPAERRLHLANAAEQLKRLQLSVLGEKANYMILDEDDIFAIEVRSNDEFISQDGWSEFCRHDYCADRVLCVSFIGRDDWSQVGVDRGGLRREFFQRFLQQLAAELVEGEGANAGNLVSNEDKLSMGKFCVLGKAIASALIHDGIMPSFLSAETMFNLVNSPRTIYEQAVAEGLDAGKARKFLADNASLLARLSYSEPVSAGYLFSILPSAAKCISAEEGTNEYNRMSQAYMFLRSFVNNLHVGCKLPDNPALIAKLPDLLGWLTGHKSRRLFSPEFTIDWLQPFSSPDFNYATATDAERRKQRQFPHVSTCGFILSLPLDCKTYAEFEERFCIAIFEGAEFGSA